MINSDLIKILRKARGKTQRALAKEAHLSFGSVQSAENGKAGLNVLIKLAQYFGVSVSSLIKDDIP